MNPNKKTSKKLPPLNQRFIAWLADIDRKLSTFFGQYLYKLQNLSETNYQLGCNLVAAGKINDGVLRFKMALKLNPQHYFAWYNLGCCYLNKGRPDWAMEALGKALAIKPDYEEARFMLASLQGNDLSPDQQPMTMPRSLLINYFELLAPEYDAVQVKQFGYKGHALLYDLMTRVWDANRINYAVLDLGCGTGLLGPLLRARAAHITGVDISRPMLDLAAARQDEAGKAVYDVLVEQDMRDYFAGITPEKFDIIAAASSLNYVGELTDIFTGASKALKPGGIFALSTDIIEGSGFVLIPGTTRFGHSLAYLRQQAARVGLTELAHEEVQLYPGIPALQCVFRK